MPLSPLVSPIITHVNRAGSFGFDLDFPQDMKVASVPLATDWSIDIDGSPYQPNNIEWASTTKLELTVGAVDDELEWMLTFLSGKSTLVTLADDRVYDTFNDSGLL